MTCIFPARPGAAAAASAANAAAVVTVATTTTTSLREDPAGGTDAGTADNAAAFERMGEMEAYRDDT